LQDIWSVCKALSPFGLALWVLPSESWEWNEVDEIFSLVDFYYLWIISVQSIQFVREKVCVTVWSEITWLTVDSECAKQPYSLSAGTWLTNRLCVTTSLSLWAPMSVHLRVCYSLLTAPLDGCLYLYLWVCSRWADIVSGRAP